ncbi:MAG: CoA-binding protein, partial [Candidatus Lokiarchaeota archaeon]|nr:CoA-binding protein [Candidatus Lokiarchaeota archaeon]
MVSKDLSFDKFAKIFYPEHIAFIGASEKSTFGAMLYLSAFKTSKWANTFYPVNPKYDRVLNWKCYPSVLDIPYPIDTTYISVKTENIPKVLNECVEKKVPWVIIFSSGFSETGDMLGLELEKELKHIIAGSNTRVVGPNCIGPYSASEGMAFSFTAKTNTPGSVSFMSQSGGHMSQLIDVGYKRDIRFRYGVSFGNQVDLNCVDFLKHFHRDTKTQVIAAYLESFGSATGYKFFLELKKTTKIKPVIIWKGGYTTDGSRAAFSHTGAIASNLRLWHSMAKQTGAVIVKDNEEFWNAIKCFELLFPKYIPKGSNVGIITPGGGSSVNTTDLFNFHNLKIPELTLESQKKISEILPYENVNIKNPVDLGALGFIVDVFAKCIEIVVADSNIDIVVIPLWPHFINTDIFKRMIQIQKSTLKPFVFCMPSIADSSELAQRFSPVKEILHEERVLYFLSLRDAAK